MKRAHALTFFCFVASVMFLPPAQAVDAKQCLRFVVGAACSDHHTGDDPVSFETVITAVGEMKKTRPLPPHTSEPYQRAASCMEEFQSYYLPLFRRGAPTQSLPSTFVASWGPINDGCDL
jgi:hypothetical protein